MALNVGVWLPFSKALPLVCGLQLSLGVACGDSLGQGAKVRFHGEMGGIAWGFSCDLVGMGIEWELMAIYNGIYIYKYNQSNLTLRLIMFNINMRA